MSFSACLRAPLILGHRGASAIAPENTLAAFSQALSDGADGIEFDVRLSSDGVPMVIHDSTLNRTGLISGTVRDLTAAQLSQVDVGSWFGKRIEPQTFAGERIPTLSEVFALFAEYGVLYVEMKCDEDEGPDLASAVVTEILAHEMKDRVVVESFNLAAIAGVKNFAPDIKTAALFEPKLSKPVSSIRRQSIIKLARQHEADEIALHHTLARGAILEEAKKEGFEIVVWTVDEPFWIDRAFTHRVKALISNNPARMVGYRGSHPSNSENSPR